ncbi:MAG: hypothetical protein HY801_10875 [Candidatus Lindowbacteria bacterium]|nr:hypothetical protein [Candidatus Lindowbacteria bacterium]
MTKPKIICWDLDETLGSFRNLISVRSGIAYPGPDDSYILRKDIIKTLNRLLNKGYRHVVTSSAKLDYSQKVLQAVCLDAYFDHVFGRDKVTDGMWGKKYIPAAELYRLDQTEASEQMLVIANMPSDEPVDAGIVFIRDQRILDESALIYETIADSLWTRGDGSFKRGFDVLFESGRSTTCLDKDFNFVLVSARIDGGLMADLGYKNSPCTAGLKVPIIMNIRPA